MNKRVTLLNQDGDVVYSVESKDAFEVNLESIQKRYATAVLITFDTLVADCWLEVATVFLQKN